MPKDSEASVETTKRSKEERKRTIMLVASRANFIPKDQSEDITQFKTISLLNMQGKILVFIRITLYDI